MFSSSKARHRGPFRSVWWAAVVLGLVLTTASQAATQDITSQFAITRSGFLLNRTTNTFDQTVTLKNISSTPVPAPIAAVLSGLPSTVTLANKAGQTSDGKPYVNPMSPGSLLQSGATLSFALKFANQQRSRSRRELAQKFPQSFDGRFGARHPRSIRIQALRQEFLPCPGR